MFTLHTVKSDTKGLDTQVNLTLKVSRNDAPLLLSDFSGGEAVIYDGYSGETINFSVISADDERRVKLVNNDGSSVIELGPEFISGGRNKSSTQLEEVPLKLGQSLYDYIITNSSWGLL